MGGFIRKRFQWRQWAGVMLSFLQSVPLCGCEQTKACVTVSQHLGLTVSCAATLRCGAKAHLFPGISVYSSNAKPVFHFTGLSVFWSCIRGKALCLNRRQITSRIPLFTFWRTWTYPKLCVCVCVCYPRLLGDMAMEQYPLRVHNFPASGSGLFFCIRITHKNSLDKNRNSFKEP